MYLPDGIWYDWWTEKSYSGAQYILAEAPFSCSWKNFKG
ncbi:MAG: hypothetical protein ACKPFF_16565 [Planktothrix sp.]